MLTHSKAIKSVKSAQRGNKLGKKIDPGRSQLGKKIGRLEVYIPLQRNIHAQFTIWVGVIIWTFGNNLYTWGQLAINFTGDIKSQNIWG